MHTTTVGEEEPWHALPARVARVTSPRTAARMNASLLQPHDGLNAAEPKIATRGATTTLAPQR